MKKCSTSYVTGELQSKTTHLSEWPKSKTLITSNAGEDVEPQNSHLLLMGKQNGTATLGDKFEVSYKMKHTQCSLVLIQMS